MRTPDNDTIAICGRGLVTALGFGVDAAWNGLVEGRSGVRTVGDAGRHARLGRAALVAPPFLRVGVPRELEAQVKFLNGAGELAVEAAHEAWRASGWSAHDVAPDRKGLWLSQVDDGDWDCGMVHAGFTAATEAFTKPLVLGETLNQPVTRSTKPFFLLESLKNNAFSFLANLFTLRGSNTSVSGYSGPSLRVLDLASRAVRRRDQDHALVVGAACTAGAVGRNDLARLGVISEIDDVAYRPLDRSGTGLVAGEGAAAVTLERHADAIARGSAPLAWILGQAASSGEPLEDAPGPRAATIADAAYRALDQAGAAPRDLLGVVVPGLGMPTADRALLEGTKALSPDAPLPVVSWRGAVGHMALAGDLADVVLAVESLGRNRLPGTVGIVDPLDTCVARTIVEGRGRAVLVLSAGLQGEVGALLLGAVP